MVWNLDTTWLFLAVAFVAMFAFMLGMALDGVMGDDGFGATGNMIVITAGFFLGVFCANSWGYRLNDLTVAVATGLGGAFVTLTVLALLKAAVGRA